MAHGPSRIEHYRSTVAIVVQAELLGYGVLEDHYCGRDTRDVPWIGYLACDIDNDHKVLSHEPWQLCRFQ